MVGFGIFEGGWWRDRDRSCSTRHCTRPRSRSKVVLFTTTRRQHLFPAVFYVFPLLLFPNLTSTSSVRQLDMTATSATHIPL